MRLPFIFIGFNLNHVVLLIASQAVKICNHLKTPPFAGCVSKLPLTQYYSSCMNDMRVCDFEARDGCQCASLTQYARDCARAKLASELLWRNGMCGNSRLRYFICEERYSVLIFLKKKHVLEIKYSASVRRIVQKRAKVWERLPYARINASMAAPAQEVGFLMLCYTVSFLDAFPCSFSFAILIRLSLDF